jgi:hypothetical protein
MNEFADDYVCTRPSRFNALCINKSSLKHLVNLMPDPDPGSSLPVSKEGFRTAIDMLPLFHPNTVVRMSGAAQDTCHGLSWKPMDMGIEAMKNMYSQDNQDAMAFLDSFKSDSAKPYLAFCANSKSDSAYSLTMTMQDAAKSLIFYSTTRSAHIG